MRVQKYIFSALFAIAIFLNLLTLPALAANQTGYPNNQEINQAAILVAPDPDFQVRIYPQPNTLKKQIGYGLAGDEVTLVQQVGSNDGQIWYFVRFNNSSLVEGWVSENYLKLTGRDFSTRTLQLETKVNPYLGSQVIKLQETPQQTLQHKQVEQFKQYNTKQYTQTLQNRGGSNYNQRD